MLPGVYLLADSGLADSGVAENGGAESGGGEVAVPGMTLTFLETGVALMGADGETVWESRWSEVAEISPSGSSVLPDGGPALQLLAVERSGRRWCSGGPDRGHRGDRGVRPAVGQVPWTSLQVRTAGRPDVIDGGGGGPGRGGGHVAAALRRPRADLLTSS